MSSNAKVILGTIALVLVGVFVFWNFKKDQAPVVDDSLKKNISDIVENPAEKLTESNPFEDKKTNPFTDAYENPFK